MIDSLPWLLVIATHIIFWPTMLFITHKNRGN